MSRWLAWVAWEWTLIASALAVAYAGPWWLLPLCMLVIGSRQQALIVLGHEVAHHTLGRNRGERIANLLCYWWAGSDLYAYRAAHIAHHQRIGLPSDPELIVRAKTPWAWSDLTRGKKALLIAMDLLGLRLHEAFYISQPVLGRYTAARIAYVGAIVSAALLAGLWPLLLLWLWTLGTATLALARLRSWREHYGLPPGQTHSYVARWWERALFLPHYVWRHADHHTAGRWNVPAWELRP